MHAQTSFQDAPHTLYRQFDLTRLDPRDAEIIVQGSVEYRQDCERKFSFESYVNIGSRPAQCKRTKGATSANELACYPGLEAFWKKNVTPALEPTQPVNLWAFSKRWEDDPAVCTACSSAVTRYLDNAQYTIWQKLPGYFRLVGALSFASTCDGLC